MISNEKTPIRLKSSKSGAHTMYAGQRAVELRERILTFYNITPDDNISTRLNGRGHRQCVLYETAP